MRNRSSSRAPAGREPVELTGIRSSSLSSAYLALGRAASTGTLAVAAVLAARELAPGGRGVLAVLVTTSSLAALLVTTGVSLAGRVLLVSPKADRVTLGAYAGLGMALMVAVTALLAAAGLTLVPLTDIHPSGAQLAVLMLHGAATVAAILSANALYAYGSFAAAPLAEIAGGTAALAATATLAASGNTRPGDYLAAMALGLVVQTTTALVPLRTRGLRLRYHSAAWRRLLRQGAAGTGVGVAQAATYRFDRYLVGLFASSAQVGLYSAAATGAELVRLVPTAVGQVVLHRVAVAGQETEEARRLRRVAIGCTAVVGLLIAAFARPLLTAVLGSDYSSADRALVLLLAAEVATAWFLLDSSLLAGLGRVGSASRAAVLGFLTVTALDLALVPSWGIEGAAIASIVGYVVMAGVARRALNSDRGSPPPHAAAGGENPVG